MDVKDIEIKLSRATTLPIFPSVVKEMLALSDNPNASARDYERVISQDAALAAKIMRTANSSYYSGSGNITTIQRAVAQLGNNTIRSICLTAAFKSSLSSAKTNRSFDVGRYWQHCLGVACSAKMMACVAKMPFAEEAFVAGLLHDLGKLAAAMFLPEETDRVKRIMDAKKISQYDSEMLCWGITHQEIGLMVAIRWGLPDVYHLPISHHHTPYLDDGSIDPLTAFIHVANALVTGIGLGMEPDGVELPVDEFAREQVGVPQEMYTKIAGVVSTEVSKLSEQMGT